MLPKRLFSSHFLGNRFGELTDIYEYPGNDKLFMMPIVECWFESAAPLLYFISTVKLAGHLECGNS
ncbi:hypothetical protein CHH67_11090 [Paenibacillus campinasensis]|uniref:Uncharacterized protein n=1 Tax=Paenibacillus campinasensis TaxID=66347 RepID=A0A268EUW3_9BACL|nr:hypothetical protein CHH67_11090 [Paenibacillus campinasensis]